MADLRMKRATGSLLIGVHTPLVQGDARAFELGSILEQAFDAYHVTGVVRFLTPSILPLDDRTARLAGFTSVLFSAPFYADTTE